MGALELAKLLEFFHGNKLGKDVPHTGVSE